MRRSGPFRFAYRIVQLLVRLQVLPVGLAHLLNDGDAEEAKQGEDHTGPVEWRRADLPKAGRLRPRHRLPVQPA